MIWLQVFKRLFTRRLVIIVFRQFRSLSGVTAHSPWHPARYALNVPRPYYPAHRSLSSRQPPLRVMA